MAELAINPLMATPANKTVARDWNGRIWVRIVKAFLFGPNAIAPWPSTELNFEMLPRYPLRPAAAMRAVVTQSSR